MSTCPFHFLPPNGIPSGGLPGVLAAPSVTLTEVMALLSRYPLAAMAVAACFGLLVGWLTRRRSRIGKETIHAEFPGHEELAWRHEKLVLTERQLVEKQIRLDDFVAGFDPSLSGSESALRIQVFLVSERMREARQKVGTDLSRMKAVRDRLAVLLPGIERGGEAVAACRGMAEAQATRLETARDLLRDLSGESLALERSVLSPDSTPDALSIRRGYMTLKGRILTLPHGWATSGEETERRIRELLTTVDHPALGPVRDILLIDGALTASLDGASTLDLTGAVTAVIAALDRIGSDRELLAVAPVVSAAPPESGFDSEATASLHDSPPPSESPLDFGFPEPDRPDAGFRHPAEFTPLAVRLSKGFRDLTQGNGNGKSHGEEGDTATPLNESDSEKTEAGIDAEDAERCLVLFCSNDVELWGRTIYRGARCRARSISEFPEWAHWISIRRLDTNERVFAPIRTASLRSGHASDPFGFNGTNELFYGARHLGLFSETCPNEVETRFTYGGWGFGHRAQEIAPEVEQLQAAGWEGREIPADTVFEIVIYEELPSLGQRDRILESEVRGVR